MKIGKIGEEKSTGTCNGGRKISIIFTTKEVVAAERVTKHEVDPGSASSQKLSV